VSDPRRLVVVGASLAGLRAVESARRTGFTGSITLIGAEDHLPYDRPPLSKKFLEAGADPGERTTFRTEDVLLTELGVELRLGSPATGLDLARREVVLGDGTVGYDVLVIATGSSARSLPGSEHLAGVHILRTLDDALALRAALDARPRHVAVVGAGFIGSEIASSARARGLDVTILESLPAPLGRALGAELGWATSLLHEKGGATLRCGTGVRAIEGNGRVERLTLSDGSVVETDLVVVGIGATPAVGWLEGSGVELASGVVCDETLATSAPGVYAAGDVAEWINPLFDRRMRVEHWTNAAEQGALAARNALDPGEARPYAAVPYFWSDWYDSRIQFVGIPSATESTVVAGTPESGRFVALYREGDGVVGALALNGQASIMKYRALIAKRAGWDEALDLAARLHSA
jgi:NADPH-dependent 2,4-dienoyl-CoA reductase/sulfur reductase-like enzyme